MERPTALVAGAASGIGRALASLLAEQGYYLVLTDIDEGRLAQAQASIAESECHTLDVTDSLAVDAVFAEVHARRPLTLVVNSVGIAIAGELRDAAVSDLREAVEINLMGTLYTSLAAYRLMAARGSGTIVNVASGSGLFPLPGRTHYTTTKFGVVGFTTALRQEAAPLGVRVCVACPGVVNTPIFSRIRLIGPLDRDAIERRLARNRGISPPEAARRIMRGVKRNRAIITIDAQVRALWRLWKYAPGLFERVSGRMSRELARYRIGPATPAAQGRRDRGSSA